MPGARCIDAAGIPDVMRGEETQLVGAIGIEETRVLAVLPGTHSKWAIVEHGRLVEFATYMTGELYAVLLAHSILGRMAAAIGSAAELEGVAFARGVVRGSAGDGLAHAIFGARTLALAGDLAPGDVGDWLSGVLIGDEIRAARGWAQAHGVDAAKVRVIGDGTLVARYVRALEEVGVGAEAAPPAAAALGLYRIAQQAGLVTR